MKLTITDEAAQWYKEELDIESGSYLRFFVRYGGIGGLIPGFSLGINNSKPRQIYTSIKVQDIIFYIEEDDHWYFENKNLHVSFNKDTLAPIFSYV